jgi:ABC-type uncharacterized transport system ATPase subunit
VPPCALPPGGGGGDDGDLSDRVIDSTRLTKYYGRQRGVEDLDLDVRVGEVFGFSGPNGAGNSTTIHMVGQIRPTSGGGTVFGLDCWRDRDAIQRRIGFLPGEFALYERLTGALGAHDREHGASHVHRPNRVVSIWARKSAGLISSKNPA